MPRLLPLFAGLFLLVLPSLYAGERTPQLIPIRDLAPGIRVEMRYATSNNFTKEILYPAAECLLCEPAARRLARVQAKLEKKGLGLKVWDCYRPLSVQKKLWNLVPDDRYVANPAKGSRHNRGASVDLTLVDKQGNELPMPTLFDEFSERAHRDFMDAPAETLKNRAILQEAMEAEGFVGLPTEWWHFDDPEWRGFALRDEPLGTKSLRTDMKSTMPPVISNQTQQLVMVVADTWASKTATLRRYQRNGKWIEVEKEFAVSLGSNGMGWGRGLTSLEWKGPLKKEGDHRTPAGIFPIGTAYGPHEKAPEGVRWPYQSIDEKWFCVDDPKSSSYNQVLLLPAGKKPNWTSAEKMRRSDPLYDWVINVEQNFPDVKTGCGSCIFFHVWRKPGSPTEGCVAMPEADIRRLLMWLNPGDKPLAIFLPREAYEVLKAPWGLP